MKPASILGRIGFLPLVIFLTVASPALAQTVTRGPYLQSPTPTTMVVRWRTDIATDSQVAFKMTDATAVIRGDALVSTEHEVLLTGLSPDTLYNYTVGTSSATLAGGNLASNGDGQHFFTTPPLSGTDRTTRIWVLGDSGTKNADAAAVRDAYKNYTGVRGTDVWLMVGDNAYNIGSDTDYQQAVFDMYPQLLQQVPLWSALGNHDGIDMAFNPPGAYPQLFTFPVAGEAGGIASGTENYYSFDYGDIHFVVLDSTMIANRAAGSPMYTWLQADLAANDSRWLIALWHHPEYSKGSHDSDAEVALSEIRANALPLLEAAGVDLVLSGHSHSYERSFLVDGHYGTSDSLSDAMVIDGGDGSMSGDGPYIKSGSGGTAGQGAVHIVIGSSGKTETGFSLDHPVMVAAEATLGSVVIDVGPNRLDAAFVTANGTVHDEFTIIKDRKVIAIDIDPWSPANEVKPASSNSIPVAILGGRLANGDANDFDAAEVNASSVRFGVGEAVNVASPLIMDIDGDSDSDQLLAFKTQDTGIFCGDTEVNLVGETIAGEAFIGTGAITTADCDDLGCHP